MNIDDSLVKNIIKQQLIEIDKVEEVERKKEGETTLYYKSDIVAIEQNAKRIALNNCNMRLDIAVSKEQKDIAEYYGEN